MTQTLSNINEIEGAFSVSDIDVFCVASATLTKGQLVAIPATSVGSGAVATVTTPTTTQRQTGMIGVCLQDAVSGDRVRVRVQGRCVATTKGDGSTTVNVGDQLFVGTGATLSGATGTLTNAPRYVALAYGGTGSAWSATSASREVIMFGLLGFGHFGGVA